MTIDTQEALRLLDDLNESVGRYADAIRNDKRNGMTGAAAASVDACVDQLRALLSAKEGEPSAENWEQALDEWRSMKFTYAEIAARAYELRDAEKEKGNG